MHILSYDHYDFSSIGCERLEQGVTGGGTGTGVATQRLLGVDACRYSDVTELRLNYTR